METNDAHDDAACAAHSDVGHASAPPRTSSVDAAAAAAVAAATARLRRTVRAGRDRPRPMPRTARGCREPHLGPGRGIEPSTSPMYRQRPPGPGEKTIPCSEEVTHTRRREATESTDVRGGAAARSDDGAAHRLQLLSRYSACAFVPRLRASTGGFANVAGLALALGVTLAPVPLALIVRSALVSVAVVPGLSMAPRISQGGVILVDKVPEWRAR